MKEVKAYKGLDQRCLIKGLLSKYFYIMFMMTMGIITTFIMTLVGVLKGTTSILSFLTTIIIAGSAYALAYVYFYKKSNTPKRTNKLTPVSYTNRELFSLLYKKQRRNEQ